MAVKLKEIDRELTMVEGAISCGLMRQRAAELRQQNYPNYAVTPWRCQCISGENDPVWRFCSHQDAVTVGLIVSRHT